MTPRKDADPDIAETARKVRDASEEIDRKAIERDTAKRAARTTRRLNAKREGKK